MSLSAEAKATSFLLNYHITVHINRSAAHADEEALVSGCSANEFRRI